jgi:hypothetical protein
MTAQEIRETLAKQQELLLELYHKKSSPNNADTLIFVEAWLGEIAAQLAEMNSAIFTLTRAIDSISRS